MCDKREIKSYTIRGVFIEMLCVHGVFFLIFEIMFDRRYAVPIQTFTNNYRTDCQQN